MTRIIAFLAAGLFSFNAFSASVEILGSRSCNKWMDEKSVANSTNDMNKVPVLITQSWFLGYLSGRADAAGKNFLKATDRDSIFVWLDNYCLANPQAGLDKAGVDLARQLMQLKGIKP